MSKPQINYANKYDRIVALIDMDCKFFTSTQRRLFHLIVKFKFSGFYCQVEEKLDPSLAGKPIAVVQYNAWRGGG